MEKKINVVTNTGYLTFWEYEHRGYGHISPEVKQVVDEAPRGAPPR